MEFITFIKDKVLGPLLVAAVLAMCAVIALQFDKRLFIHLLGGVADGDPVYLCASTAGVPSKDSRVITEDPYNGTNVPAIRSIQVNGTASQQWIIQLKKPGT
jgi:hypothetical protein